MTQAAATSQLGELILVRLLVPPKRGLTPGRLRKDLERFFRTPPNSEQWQEALEELVSGGLLTARPYRLTDVGRGQALRFLGVEFLFPGTTWKNLPARYLVPKALGIPTEATDLRRRIRDEKGLGALLLKRHYDLPVGAAPTLDQALEALACKLICKKMGLAPRGRLSDLKESILAQHLDPSAHLNMGQLKKQLPRHAAGATGGGANGLRTAVLREWLASSAGGVQQIQDQPGPAPVFDPSEFAGTVRAAAPGCPTGRFGDNKVFISHLWAHLQREPAFRHMDLNTFKAHLAEANHAGLLRLSRADLVQAMDPDDVRNSETKYLDATFHFVLIERDQP